MHITDSKPDNLQDHIVGLIRELRNERNVDTCWPDFQRTVEENLPELLQTLSIKWLVSICDTYTDYGDPLSARHAMTITFFVQMLRLAETVRFTRPTLDADRVSRAKSMHRVTLESGLMTFSIDHQDVFLNLTRRFGRQVKDDRIMREIWHEILRRIQEGENVITEFSRQSPVRERYFPVDATGLRDNYGR